MKKNSLLSNLLKCKTPDELIDAGNKSELKKTLNVFDLIVIGIGAVVGTGVFLLLPPPLDGFFVGAVVGLAVGSTVGSDVGPTVGVGSGFLSVEYDAYIIIPPSAVFSAYTSLSFIATTALSANS